MDRKSFIEKLIGGMSIEQKVGQCLVIGFTGTVITPKIIERIKRYCPAGIRTGLTFRMKSAYHDPYATSEKCAYRVLREPTGTVKDILPGMPVPVCANSEYCHFLNTMKKAALNNDLGIPLHMTFDMGGDTSTDYFHGGIRFFPSAMGITRSGNPKLAYDVAWAIARQVIPLGYNWIHSPVLDVNTNPLNPEVGTRSYGENANDAIIFAMEAMKGLRDGGLITTGKHFPGRGESISDAHHGLPTIELSRKDMAQHLAPFQSLIDSGLPAIMSAHSAYPALDPSGLPASLSKVIVTDILKGEMNFKGVVTTDDITMGGIVENFEVLDACIRALNAGNDLILFRDESTLIDEVYPLLVNAVKSGVIKESRLDDAILRTLSVKYDNGLFDGSKGIMAEGDAGNGILDEKVKSIARESAAKTVHIIRDEAKILPVGKDKKILLIEQINPLHKMTNSQECHPGILWEKMLEYSDNVAMVEVNTDFTEDDKRRIMRRLDEAEIIVTTNYYYRRGTGNNDFIRELHRKCTKPIVVITNSPYPMSVSDEYKTIIVTYGISPESISEVAKTIFTRR